MKRKLTAYFSDSEAAGSAAFDISQMLGEGSEIIVGREKSEKARAFDSCIALTFLGGITGVTAALILRMLAFSYMTFGISPFTGLLCGMVIGAICGCIIDFANYDLFPIVSHITVSLNNDKCSLAIKQLRKKGAIKTVLLKQAKKAAAK